MAHSRDFAELTELLASQKGTYRLLLSLSQSQPKVFEKGGSRALIRLLARKQALIDQLEATDGRLSIYTGDWEHTMASLPEPARREVAALVTETSTLVHQLVDSERVAEAFVASARDAKAAEIRSVADGRAAVSAYTQGAAVASGRFYDREE